MNSTLLHNTHFLNMESTKLSFNNICSIFRNCYPSVTDGIYSLDNPDLSDFYLSELETSTNDNFDNGDIYFSDGDNDSLMSEKEFLLENIAVGTIDLLLNTVVKVHVSEHETPEIMCYFLQSSCDLNSICEHYSINDINISQLNISTSDNELYLSDISVDSSSILTTNISQTQKQFCELKKSGSVKLLGQGSGFEPLPSIDIQPPKIQKNIKIKTTIVNLTFQIYQWILGLMKDHSLLKILHIL